MAALSDTGERLILGTEPIDSALETKAAEMKPFFGSPLKSALPMGMTDKVLPGWPSWPAARRADNCARLAPAELQVSPAGCSWIATATLISLAGQPCFWLDGPNPQSRRLPAGGHLTETKLTIWIQIYALAARKCATGWRRRSSLEN